MNADPIHAKREQVQTSHTFQDARVALIIVDMQRGFLDTGASLEVAAGRDTIPANQALLRTFRELNAPVVFTRFIYHPAAPVLRGSPFGPEHLPVPLGECGGFGKPSGNCLVGPEPGKGPESADIIPDLAPLPDEFVVDALTYDKFYGTPLDLVLRSHAVTHLAITGVTTDVCVNSTVIGGAMRDYRISVISDAVAAPCQELQDACFTIWENKFARLISSEAAIAELNS